MDTTPSVFTAWSEAVRSSSVGSATHLHRLSVPTHDGERSDETSPAPRKYSSEGTKPFPPPRLYPLKPAQALRLHNLDGQSGSFRSNMLFAGHTKAVTRATYGATTRLIYSCARDATIRQWNRSDSSALRVFEGHDMACTALALSAGSAAHQRPSTAAMSQS